MAPRRRGCPCSTLSDAELISKVHEVLLGAANEGDLSLFKSTAKVLDLGRGRLREAVERARWEGGQGALHLAAAAARMEVCRYLVEELRVDVDDADMKGSTPLISAVLSENVAVVKYLLDHGANPDKADDDGFTPLHTAAGIGNCEMLELLLAKGAYIDAFSMQCGTPLHIAAKERQADAMKVLLDHNANCKKTYTLFGMYDMTPLFQATSYSSVKCVKLLVEAGADVNSDCFLTAVLGSTAGNDDSTECLNFLLEAVADCNNSPHDGENKNKRKAAQLKSLGNAAVDKKDYFPASAFYGKAMDLDPDDATLLSNRSLCCLRMGDGQKALMDALECKKMRPDWSKACYRQGTALMLLEDYESACEALLDGLKLDPENAEIEDALWKSLESLKISKCT